MYKEGQWWEEIQGMCWNADGDLTFASISTEVFPNYIFSYMSLEIPLVRRTWLVNESI